MMIELINKARPKRSLTYNLPHDICCAKIGKCSCTLTTLRRRVHLPDGKIRYRKEQRRLPPSLMIPADGKVTVHKALLNVEEIDRDVGNGTLHVAEIKVQVQEPVKPASKPPKKPAEKATKKSTKESTKPRRHAARKG